MLFIFSLKLLQKLDITEYPVSFRKWIKEVLEGFGLSPLLV
ncbi:Hypothetical protein BN2458_PEG0279 [Helicobacter typhlonius]|uniref:Uncharacterized protein n=1 Tax=Helicobacter typhlonius TaxID=76936 RepID=A0A0S4PVB2_9HELI|nr:Hypothetical protein BN2458_PEG0279 [Helicobacter typhlonius]